ncbi:MAG: hypothetical protein J6K84_01080 [Oscillospiraceae bacterium]|nr:hypothetical protein [Oscillospiraceae bacterium]
MSAGKEKTPRSEEEKQQEILDLRRGALLRYVVIMFAVALVLVLLSMVLQTKSSNSTISELHQSSTSAIQKAEALQDTNRMLQEQLATQKSEYEAKIAQLEQDAESHKAELESLKAQVENNTALCDALATLVMSFGDKKAPAVQDSITLLETVKEWLSPSVATQYEAWMTGKVK